MTLKDLHKRRLSNLTPVNYTVDTNNLIVSYGKEGTTGDVVDGVNGINGTISGTVTRGVSGLVSTGNCFQYAGGKVIVPHNSLLNIGSKNFAFSVWINWDSINNTAFFNKRAGTDYEWQLYYANGTLMLVFFNTDGSTFQMSYTPNFLINTDYHITGRLVSNKIEVRINNILQSGTVSGSRKTLNTTTTDLTIGESVWNGSKFLGKMDELRIWIGDTIPPNFNNEWNSGNGITL